MSDLISRQAAIKAVGFYSLHSGDKLLFADKLLKELPSAEKKGMWIHRKNWSRYVCDQCSFESREASRYCPNCGARMEEKR